MPSFFTSPLWFTFNASIAKSSHVKQSNIHRRRFIKQGALASAGLFVLQLPVWAKRSGNAGNALPVHNIPAEKNLDPAWVKSLYNRGNATTYLKSRNELKYIGMPAGGLHCGTLYLGGDGRLWLWSIYNDEREGVDPKTALWYDGTSERKIISRDGANFVEPSVAANRRILEQGFAIQFVHNGKTIIKELREEDWDEVSFEATYPVAKITYTTKDIPVKIVMLAGGFFIPLNADDSGLPATCLSIEVHNTSSQNISYSLVGWLENGTGKAIAATEEGTLQNKTIISENVTGIAASFNAAKETVYAKAGAGTMCFALMDSKGSVNTNASLFPVNDEVFNTTNSQPSSATPAEKLIGSVVVKNVAAAGDSSTQNFVITWHFANANNIVQKLAADAKQGYYYGKRFANAEAVMAYIVKNFNRLQTQTYTWQQTWYNSTLPWWFLERTLLNIGTIATANTYRFATGRFWGWEGINSCEGTCTHVWQYAQALGRIFPSLERDTRQRVDLGIAMQENGGILFRGEDANRPAIDGQAGTILRIYREHQMSADISFLQNNWANIKKAVTFMMAQDKNGDGMIDTPMENTLDAMWDGEIAWIVGLCIAAAKASQLMSEEMDDKTFAALCSQYVEKGSANMASQLFNGEYFIHKPDAVKERQKLGSYNTCHIDQVYGQSWAWQVGLGRLWDKDKTISALRALWKYNFAPDVGPYIKTHLGGRPYALEGDAGLIMNTNPYNEARPYGEEVTWQMGYFHECMTGFEHQVAAHMMAEGMTDEALVITRSIHDRYSAAKRNPFNEIECSDHYARAMASYGTFITACGFEYHGPKGHISFNPAFGADNFHAPFTVAEGWGTYSQRVSNNQFTAQLQIKYGKLNLKEWGVTIKNGRTASKVIVKLNNEIIPCTWHNDKIILNKNVTVSADEILHVEVN